MAISQLYPTNNPVYGNNFAGGKKLDSNITFTRASTGTYVDNTGIIRVAEINQPRFTHNPVTGECLGLLLEPSRTNLLLSSEEFTGASWLKVRCSTTTNVETAPDGLTTADKLVEDSTTEGRYIQSAVAIGAGTYTHSIYVKAAENNSMVFRPVHLGEASSTSSITFNLTTGPTATTNNLITGATMQVLPNGWRRCSVTLTLTPAVTYAAFRIHLRDEESGSISYTGDGTSGIYIWGAQVEAGSFPTSYIPTTTSTATRNASLADLISGAIANNIRSFYVEFSSPAVGTRGVVSLNDNTANERASVLTSGTDPRLVVQDGGVEQASINGGTVAAGVRTRVAVRINADDFAISINGGAVVTDTSGTLPTVDRLMFGRTQAGEYLNGRIARFTGWSQLLPNATLQTLAQ